MPLTAILVLISGLSEEIGLVTCLVSSTDSFIGVILDSKSFVLLVETQELRPTLLLVHVTWTYHK